eukprot:3456122-Prymnesium_polylepis.2
MRRPSPFFSPNVRGPFSATNGPGAHNTPYNAYIYVHVGRTTACHFSMQLKPGRWSAIGPKPFATCV